eukprot:1012163-Pyramimonas_sp.AAC.1
MQQAPGLVVPSCMGELRPEILAIHEAQQANLSTQLARQRRNQERQASGLMGRAGQPACYSNSAAFFLYISPRL